MMGKSSSLKQKDDDFKLSFLTINFGGNSTTNILNTQSFKSFQNRLADKEEECQRRPTIIFGQEIKGTKDNPHYTVFSTFLDTKYRANWPSEHALFDNNNAKNPFLFWDTTYWKKLEKDKDNMPYVTDLKLIKAIIVNLQSMSASGTQIWAISLHAVNSESQSDSTKEGEIKEMISRLAKKSKDLNKQVIIGGDFNLASNVSSKLINGLLNENPGLEESLEVSHCYCCFNLWYLFIPHVH
jgi:hypothetical protein